MQSLSKTYTNLIIVSGKKKKRAGPMKYLEHDCESNMYIAYQYMRKSTSTFTSQNIN